MGYNPEMTPDELYEQLRAAHYRQVQELAVIRPMVLDLVIRTAENNPRYSFSRKSDYVKLAKLRGWYNTGRFHELYGSADSVAKLYQFVCIAIDSGLIYPDNVNITSADPKGSFSLWADPILKVW